MRANHWWYVLLLLGCAQAAHSEEVVTDDVSLMEVIEILGEMDDEITDIEIAMSDLKLDEIAPVQEEKYVK